MAATWLVVYRALLLLAAVFGLILLFQVRTHLDKPGVKPLILLVAGSLLYIAVKLTVSLVRGTPTVYLVTRFNPLGAGLATLGFFLLVVEYVGIEQPVSRRTTGLLLVEPVLVSSIVWIDVDWLWIPVGKDASTLSGYGWELTSLAIANQLYMNGLLILGAGLLLWFGIRSTGVFKKQGMALVLAVSGPIVGNLAFYAGYIPFNLTPVTFIFSGFLLAGAIFWTDLFDIVPLGHKAVVTNLDACVLTIERDHRLIDTNESTRRRFGLPDADELVGRDIGDVFAEHPDFRELYRSITHDGATISSPVELDDRYYSVDVVELGNSGEPVLGRTMIMRDVTAQTRRRQELERKNDQLERFATVLSHDLRNPLNVASARLQLAREDPQADHFEAISTAHDRMETLIDDVLTVAKEGKTVSHFESIDLADFVETCWFNVETEAATLRIETDRRIQANPVRVRQLFENLFRNAIEHAGEDVTVTIGDLPDGFSVEDDGPGIAEENRDTIFDMGYSTGQGTGFGLDIVERIATAHGWAVDVTEGTDGGARFEFTAVSVDEK